MDLRNRPLIHRVRAALEEAGIEGPHPRICVVAPSNGSHGFVRRRFLRETVDGFLRWRFTEPEALVRQIGEPPLIRAGWHPEPPGWMESTVALALPRLSRSESAVPPGTRLEDPGWLPVLANAMSRLEAAGVVSEELAALDHPGDRARVELLAALLEQVERARRADRVYGAADAARAALEAIREDRVPRTVARDEALVVYGDRTLSPLTFDALTAWLKARRGVRIVFRPHEAAPISPTGLRRAAVDAGYAEVHDAFAGPEALIRLRAGLFAAPGPAGSSNVDAPREAVSMIRALDDVREVREVVRAVLDALRDGAPLDGIAIALPDAGCADLLKLELDRAGAPASFIAGPPLARTGAARALVGAFSLDSTTVSPETLHRLLQHPDVRVRSASGHGSSHQSRWRRHLVDIGAVRGFDRIRAALDDLRRARTAEDPNHRDLASIDGLVGALTELRRAIELAPSGTWSSYRARFRDFADRWLRAGPARSALLELLDGRIDATGPTISSTLASTLLSVQLERDALKSGGVNDAAVRVVPPLALVGSRFHTVIAPGLTDQAFPAPPVADPILDDDLVHALNEQLQARLESSDIGDDLERRRLAALVGAAEQRLVLTFPRSDLGKGRDLQPSPFLTEITAALGFGRTAEALHAFVRNADTNAVGTGLDPGRAVNAAEHRLSMIAKDPELGIPLLATSPSARGLLEAALSRDRLRAALSSGHAVELDPHTGRISGQLLPDDFWDRTWSAWELRRLLDAPLDLFLKVVLQAYAPHRFPHPPDPWDARAAERAIRQAAEAALSAGAEWPEAWERELERQLAADAQSLEPEGIEILSQHRLHARDSWRVPLQAVVGGGVIEDGTPLHPSVPLKLRSTPFAIAGDGGLVSLAPRKPNVNPDTGALLEPAIQAMALGQAGLRVDTLRLAHPERTSRPADAASAATAALELLQGAVERIRAGEWPHRSFEPRYAHPALLAEDPVFAGDEE